MILDNQHLSTLSAQAKANPRLRQNYDLRNSEEDNSQRMLNALEPGMVMPIHRHRKTSETICMVRGKMVMRLYDDKGNVTDEFVMKPCGEHPMVQVEKRPVAFAGGAGWPNPGAQLELVEGRRSMARRSRLEAKI